MNGSRHILIVDDQAESANMVAEAVRDVSDQFEVRVSTDAGAAIAEIQQAQDAARGYDLVITDIKRPGSSGMQLLETLATIAPATKTITMTAYHSPELAEQAQQLGVHAYLIKPIAPSELRQVVQKALSGVQSSAEMASLAGQLPIAQRTTAERRLANLRALTNSTVALLARIDGTILAVDSLDTGTDAGALCRALIDCMHTIAQAMSQALNTDAPIQQSYYGTQALSICTYRMDSSHLIVTIFGPTVREGNVWYCMRETAQELASVLASQEQAHTTGLETPLRNQAGDDWRSKIEQYFTETPAQRTRNRRASASQPFRPLPSLEPAEPSPIQIERDIPVANNRDPAVADTGRKVEEIDLQEAQQRGWYTPKQPQGTNADFADMPSAEDIDWEVSIDLDWDTLVANTDQGFAGMDFDEAKKQGLVDDIETAQ